MPEIKLLPGETLLVKIVRISPCSKIFPVGGVNKCKHNIDILDIKTGNTATCEYLINEGSQIEFQEGLSQYVKCTLVAAWGTMTIAPTDLPEDRVPYNPPTSALPKGTTDGSTGIPPKTGPVELNAYSSNASGQRMTFATGFAKDIFIAKMARWPADREVTSADIDDMMADARQIAIGMFDTVTF